jgi:hypothetical protein
MAPPTVQYWEYGWGVFWKNYGFQNVQSQHLFPTCFISVLNIPSPVVLTLCLGQAVLTGGYPGSLVAAPHFPLSISTVLGSFFCKHPI